MQAVAWTELTQLLAGSSSPASTFQSLLSLVNPFKTKSAPSYSTYVSPEKHDANKLSGAASEALASVSLKHLSTSMRSGSTLSIAGGRAPTAQSIIFPFLANRRTPAAPRTFLAPYLRSNYSTHIRPTFSPQAFGGRRHISLWPKSWSSSSNNAAGSGLLARIRLLEVNLAQDPKDVSKQLALWNTLFETGHADAHGKIVSQWERMCEFDNTSPLLHSDPAFELYLKSLVATGHTESIPSAVRRREALVAAHPLPLKPETTEPVVAVSPSQVIADKVLADPPPKPARWPFSMAGGKIPGAAVAADGVTSPIRVVVEESRGYVIWRIIRFTGLTLLFGFIGLTFLSLMLENSGLMKAGPAQKEWEPASGKPVKFSDVHGVDEAKEDLEEIVEFLKNPTKFSSLGGRLPKGVLLTGPPGTGKTLLAKAVAGEAGVPFLFASGSEFDEIFVGTGAKRVRELFAAARKKQPAIVFIDELDAIGSKRGARDQHYMKQTLNQLLVELDGFKESEGVIVIAATNFPESLDQALVRPGRFDKKVVVPLPDVKGRAQILAHHMRDILSDVAVDPTIIARGTTGFSGADLQNLVNQAAIQASREGAKGVGLKHFEWAKDKILMGAERRSAVISEKEKRMTAYHEAGHALVAMYTDGATPLHKVTCMPRGHTLGVTQFLPDSDRVSITYNNYVAQIDVAMGGRAAEELIYGKRNVTSGCSSDIKQATNVATGMIRYYGYSDALGPIHYGDNVSPEKRNQIDAEIKQLVTDGFSRARNLLENKKVELDRLAEALVEHETLDFEEVKKVIKGDKIRQIDHELEELREELGYTPKPTPEGDIAARTVLSALPPRPQPTTPAPSS